MFSSLRNTSVTAFLAASLIITNSCAQDTTSTQKQSSAQTQTNGKGPNIDFERKTIECGEFIEGKIDKIDATFIVKNTGDQVLKLQTVKPGCGCTVVKFDSTIQPGKSVKIESSVNIKGYHAGGLNKGITVTSNAINEPVSRLAITATILPIIDVSERFVKFDSTTIMSGFKLYLSTKKTDLKINEVLFRTQNESFPVKFTFTQTDSVNEKGMKRYQLTLSNPQTNDVKAGDLLIKTNHSDKAEISVRGRVE